LLAAVAPEQATLVHEEAVDLAVEAMATQVLLETRLCQTPAVVAVEVDTWPWGLHMELPIQVTAEHLGL
jgi:hypothetical protein